MRVLGVLLICVAVASADPVDVTLTDTQSSGPSVPAVDTTLTFAGLPAALSDGTLTISAFGDFGQSSEAIDVSADSGAFSLGRYLNEITADDLFGHPTDVGSEGLANVVAIATIPLATLNSLLADGQIDVFLDYSTDVDLNFTFDPDLVVSVRLQYSGVPEPGTCALLCAGLIGCAVYRRRRRTS